MSCRWESDRHGFVGWHPRVGANNDSSQCCAGIVNINWLVNFRNLLTVVKYSHYLKLGYKNLHWVLASAAHIYKNLHSNKLYLKTKVKLFKLMSFTIFFFNFFLSFTIFYYYLLFLYGGRTIVVRHCISLPSSMFNDIYYSLKLAGGRGLYLYHGNWQELQIRIWFFVDCLHLRK